MSFQLTAEITADGKLLRVMTDRIRILDEKGREIGRYTVYIDSMVAVREGVADPKQADMCELKSIGKFDSIGGYLYDIAQKDRDAEGFWVLKRVGCSPEGFLGGERVLTTNYHALLQRM
jgi:hypothetical protein